jgi:iron complex transport system permease protein
VSQPVFHSYVTKRIVTRTRVFGVSALLLIILAVVSSVSMFVGPSGVGTSHVWNGILSLWSQSHPGLSDSEKIILLDIRLPRIIFAGIVGATLSIAGVVFQALLRNPLADPYILGVYGGSAVGAIIAIMTGLSALPFGISGLAFLGASLTIIFLFTIAGTGRAMPANTLLLAGVIMNAFFSAVIMFLITISKNTEIHGIMFWLMGDLGVAAVREITFTGAFLVPGFIAIYAFARPLNLIVTGEETAMQLGVNVAGTKIILFVIASLVTAAAVSVSGIIGFVGLMIPHMVRMIFGSDHRLLLPASALFGAAFLIAADSIARTVMAPAELPVGVITALCGAPYFVYLLKRKSV